MLPNFLVSWKLSQGIRLSVLWKLFLNVIILKWRLLAKPLLMSRYKCGTASYPGLTWTRHQMETFSALLAPCEENPPVTGGFPSQRPVTRSFDIFFDLRLNICMNKRTKRRWFETPSHSLWRHCNADKTLFAETKTRWWLKNKCMLYMIQSKFLSSLFLKSFFTFCK